jgi:hypothetical protein
MIPAPAMSAGRNPRYGISRSSGALNIAATASTREVTPLPAADFDGTPGAAVLFR